MPIKEVKTDRIRATRGKKRGAVVPRPFMIQRWHAGGVTTPILPVLCRPMEQDTNIATTGATSALADGTRSMQAYALAQVVPTLSNAPLAGGPKFPMDLVAAPASTDFIDWTTIDMNNPTTRRIWGLEESMRASEAGGYSNLAPCAWDNSLHLTIEGTKELVTRLEKDTGSSSTTTRARTTVINGEPFYVVAAQYQSHHESHPFIDAGINSQVAWESHDIDDLRRANGVQIWKVYPKDHATTHTFTVSDYDCLKTYMANHSDEIGGFQAGVLPENYREWAASLAQWDAHTLTTEGMTSVWWYIVYPRTYNYPGAGTETGYDGDLWDHKELRGTAKVVVQQKWLYFDRSDETPGDTTAT